MVKIKVRMDMRQYTRLHLQKQPALHCLEDPDLSQRILKENYQTVFIPNAFVYHKRRVSWKKFYQQATHTKDGFQWSREEEEDFIEKLKIALEKDPKPLLTQSKKFRKDRRTRDLKKQTEEGLKSSIKLMPSALAILEEVKIPKQSDIPTVLPPTKERELRKKSIKYRGYTGI